MPPENPHNFIAAKEISESVLLSPNGYQVYVIQCQLAHH
jgi:hypothetical protein